MSNTLEITSKLQLVNILKTKAIAIDPIASEAYTYDREVVSGDYSQLELSNKTFVSLTEDTLAEIDTMLSDKKIACAEFPELPSGYIYFSVTQ